MKQPPIKLTEQFYASVEDVGDDEDRVTVYRKTEDGFGNEHFERYFDMLSPEQHRSDYEYDANDGLYMAEVLSAVIREHGELK